MRIMSVLVVPETPTALTLKEMREVTYFCKQKLCLLPIG